MRRSLTAAAGGPARRSLTAAAQRVNPDTAGSTFRSSMGAKENWQDFIWTAVKHVSELQYWLSWRAWSASRCRMVASAVDEQGAPTGYIEDDDPNAALVRSLVTDIAGGVTGQASLIHRAAYLISAVGECWAGMIVRDPAREEAPDGGALPVDINEPGYDREQWYVFNRKQITAGTGGRSSMEVTLPDGTRHKFNPGVDILFRIWMEHPEDPRQPFSPCWSARDDLNEIMQTTATIDAANNSRLIGNGIAFVPQEMSLPSAAGAPVAVPLGDNPPDLPPPIHLPNAAQQLQDLIYDVASVAKREPGSMAQMLPIFAAVPGDQIKNAVQGWMKPHTEVPKTALETRTEATKRLAVGLDTAPERLLGLSQGNHWSAWAIDESDIKVHVSPIVELIVAAFTQVILRRKLADARIDPDAYVIWYETTALTQDPDKTDEAKDAFDRGAITAAALREHMGFDATDGYDLQTKDGWIQLALDKVAQDPANASVFGPIIQAAAALVGLEVREPQAALPPGNDTEDDEDADAEPEEPQGTEETPDGSEPDVGAAGMTVARLCVNRALELANKRRRTRSNLAAFRDTEVALAHTQLGPVELTEVDDMIKGWASGLSDGDLAEMGMDPHQFRGMVSSVAAVALVTASPPVLTASMLPRRR